jgi:coproporphyrinogen III oxidase
MENAHLLHAKCASKAHQNEVSHWMAALQDSICWAIAAADGKGKFREDSWKRPGGGGGRTRILTGGNIIEKGGVNFSAVHGKLPDVVRKNLKVQAEDFFATGVSIVMHPHNPFVPIIHMNIRYFEMNDGTSWFGGGIDLTPHYIDDEDAAYFHHTLKTMCDKHDANFYPEFKKWADDYFYIPHRKETRGIGGIFFDRLKPQNPEHFEAIWAFVQDTGRTFAPLYTYFMRKNYQIPYSEENKQWQYVRRGRYAEFNLIYDAGTKFGLETDGRIESILMSLPPQAAWIYDFRPGENTPEAKTLSQLVKGISWAELLPMEQ